MSSILKALRKLEDEKRGGQLEAPDLRVDQGQPAAAGRPFVPLAAGTVLGIVLVGLLFLWSSGPQRILEPMPGENRVPAAPAEIQAQRLPQAGVDQPVVSLPEQALPETPAPASVEPVPSVKNTPAVSGPAVPPVQSAADSAPSIQAKHTGRAAVATTPQPGKLVQHDLSPKAVQLPAGISLSVSEIFYLDDVNSMAVVNDLPVMVGSYVDAAVVTEIHADRVLFEIDGQTYTVNLPKP